MGMLDLTVVVPARNEAAGIGQFLVSLCAYQHRPAQILVVDDYSNDGTAAVVRQAGVTCLVHGETQGYGGAIRAGLAKATRPWVTIMTADGSDSVTDLIHMYHLRHRTAMIVGDRWGLDGTTYDYPLIKGCLNQLGNSWIGWKTQTGYADWTNPFKLYLTADVQAVLPRCIEPGLSAGLEIALRVWQQHRSFCVIPHHWTGRKTGRSHFHLLSTSVQYVRTVRRILS